MDIPNRASDAGPDDELEPVDDGREYSADYDLELYDEVLGCEDFDEEL
jgi:hypothetical protein